MKNKTIRFKYSQFVNLSRTRLRSCVVLQFSKTNTNEMLHYQHLEQDNCVDMCWNLLILMMELFVEGSG